MPRKSTSLKESVPTHSGKRKAFIAVVVVLGLVATTGAVLWGRSDVGQIDVSATIQNSQNTGVEGAEAPGTPSISNELAAMPNGGLVPPGTDSVPAPVPEPIIETPPATTTASTTVEGDVPVEAEAEGEEQTQETTVTE